MLFSAHQVSCLQILLSTINANNEFLNTPRTQSSSLAVRNLEFSSFFYKAGHLVKTVADFK